MKAHIGYFYKEKKNEYVHTAVLVPEMGLEAKFFKTGDPEEDLKNATEYAVQMGYDVMYSKNIKEFREANIN
jgi:hypothetical protein